MWFHDWHSIERVLAVGTAAYLTLVALLRLTGKRTLAKLNAFDFIVTVALGSTLASLLLSSTTTWSQGVVALALLVALQYGIALVSRLLPHGRDVVTARPAVLLWNGEPVGGELDRQRVTLDELRQAVRASGQGDLAAIAAVVLETDGSLSVVPRSAYGDGSAFDRVPDVDRDGRPD